MTVTSGQRCLELYKKFDPVGLLVRMLLESSVWSSTLCYLTWKVSATPAKRLLFRLVPSMPTTEETAVQLWPTPRANDAEKRGAVSADPRNGLPGAVRMDRFFPSPKASDSKLTGPAGSKSQKHDAKKGNLRGVVLNLFPTPTTRDFKSPDMNPNSKRFSQKTELNSVIGGQLNPMWVEWLMGFPLGWTSLDASETPSCPSSSTPSSGQ